MSNYFTKPFQPLGWQAAPHDFTGDNQLGIYTSETTQRYVYGTRYLTWDGRVYKYMLLTTGGGVSYHGVANTLEAVTTWTTAVAGTAGSRDYTITDTGISEDQLAGAMIELYDSTIDNSHTIHIVGNDASGASTTKIYLEFPLPVTMTTSDAVEVFENPYRAVSEASNSTAAWVGIPCVTAATTYNIWAQTWGPALVSPGNTTLDDAAANERLVQWKYNATVCEIDDSDGYNAAGKGQTAGYILNAGTSDIAGPQIYLMCST